MKKETLKSTAVVSLFWGALWGIAEATIGYLAHLVVILPGIAGFVMFPIGFYFMTRAYKENGKPGIIFSTAAVAASIKLLDLFLPGLSPIYTLNPATAILMEAAAVFLVYKARNRVPAAFRFQEVLMASGGWRLGFLFYSAVLSILSLSGEFMQMGLEHILRFILLEPVINALIITAFLKAGKVFKLENTREFRVGPALSGAVFSAAVLVKLALALG